MGIGGEEPRDERLPMPPLDPACTDKLLCERSVGRLLRGGGCSNSWNGDSCEIARRHKAALSPIRTKP